MLPTADHSSPTHGTRGLLLAYSTVLVPMLFAMWRSRARAPKQLLLAPLLAGALTVLAGILSSILGSVLGLADSGFLRLMVGLGASVGVGYAGGLFFARRSASGPAYRRGAVVFGANDISRNERGVADNASVDPSTPITLAGLPVATEDETKHFKLIGTTGTGKSTAIREILRTALARGDRAVIADPDGGYLGNFYDAPRGDVILNPFERDSVRWNLFGEIAQGPDVDQLARSLIPDSGEDRSWSEYARTFFSAIVHQSRAVGVTDDAEVFRLITKAPLKELKGLLGNTAAGPFLAQGNERMFGSVRAVTSSAVRALGYITQQKGEPFSVRRWVTDGSARGAGGAGGVLFLPYKAGEIAALRTMISAWLRLAIFEAMNRREGDQRLWFVVDELDALGQIDGLKDALARLRKFGGRSVLGFQSISQVSGTYGKAAADTIVENCGNTLILRCSASEQGGTSQFASRLIGQREVVHTVRSKTRRPMQWMASTTRSEQLNIEPAVMASEIERLADLEGFLKLASVPDWRRVRLTPVEYPQVIRVQAPAAGPTNELPSAPVAASSNDVKATTRGTGRRKAATPLPAAKRPPAQ